MDWYYVENDLRMGPISEKEFQNLVDVGRILPETLVWQPEMADWLPYSQALVGGAPSGPRADAPLPEATPEQQQGPSSSGGAWIADAATREQHARESQQSQAFQNIPVVPNYLVQSIIATLCCCLPFGIAAIVFASQVNGYLAVGDVEKARESSDKAKMFCWISLGIGLLWTAFMFFIQFLPVMMHF